MWVQWGGVSPALGQCLDASGGANNNPGMLYNASQDNKVCGGVAIQ